MELGKEGLKARLLCIAEPEKIRHSHRSFSWRESSKKSGTNGA